GLPLLVAAGRAAAAGGARGDPGQHRSGGGARAALAVEPEPGRGRRAHADRHAPAFPGPAPVPARGLDPQPLRAREDGGTGMNWRTLKSPAFLTALLVLSAAAIGMQAAIERYRIYLRKLPIYAEGGRALLAIPEETEHWVRVGKDHVEDADT